MEGSLPHHFSFCQCSYIQSLLSPGGGSGLLYQEAHVAYIAIEASAYVRMYTSGIWLNNSASHLCLPELILRATVSKNGFFIFYLFIHSSFLDHCHQHVERFYHLEIWIRSCSRETRKETEGKNKTPNKKQNKTFCFRRFIYLFIFKF